jgi:hypothetical protein
MDNPDQQLSTAENLLWWLGWRPQLALKLAIGLGLGAVILLSTVAAVLLALIVLGAWYRGTQLVNRLGPGFLADAESAVKMAGARKLGLEADDGEWFVLCDDRGPRPVLVSSAPEYRFDVLHVADDFVGVYPGTVYDMRSRKGTFGATTKELYFRHIVSVEYNTPDFRLTTTNGEPLVYHGSTAPEVGEAALNAIRQRLRALRTATA